jgi:EpsI family protein
MSGVPMKNWLIGLALLASVITSVMLKPAPVAANQVPKIVLETLIPKQFEGWKLDESPALTLASPDQEALLKQIYSQILTRTYVSSHGRRIMLSIVYGDGMDRQMDVHRPEVCYPAQGFQVSQYADQLIQTLFGGISVRRLVATKDQRNEPISYWIKIGDKTFNSPFDRKMQRIKQALVGRIDSGMLIRISSINNNNELAYKEQEEFINAMLKAMPDSQRKQLIGDQQAETSAADNLNK